MLKCNVWLIKVSTSSRQSTCKSKVLISVKSPNVHSRGKPKMNTYWSLYDYFIKNLLSYSDVCFIKLWNCRANSIFFNFMHIFEKRKKWMKTKALICLGAAQVSAFNVQIGEFWSLS